MSTSKRDPPLVCIDGSGRVVAGSLILRKNKPKWENGKKLYHTNVVDQLQQRLQQ
jgi:hypothetical protein